MGQWGKTIACEDSCSSLEEGRVAVGLGEEKGNAILAVWCSEPNGISAENEERAEEQHAPAMKSPTRTRMNWRVSFLESLLSSRMYKLAYVSPSCKAETK